MFNSLKYAKQLEKAGVSREQAEAHLQILAEVMESNLATREDVKDIRQEFKDVRKEIGDVRGEITRLRQEIKSDIQRSEQRMTIRIGTIVSIAIGAAVAILQLIK
jgi:predicted ribosome quality control (RQC) complex YloA/Tae2 family protein